MELAQRIEMLELIRELRGRGEPEKAADVQAALDEDEYFLGGRKLPTVGNVSEPKRSAKREAWIEYAKHVSDIEHEIIDKMQRNDLIAMLKANGLIEAA